MWDNRFTESSGTAHRERSTTMDDYGMDSQSKQGKEYEPEECEDCHTAAGYGCVCKDCPCGQGPGHYGPCN